MEHVVVKKIALPFGVIFNSLNIITKSNVDFNFSANVSMEFSDLPKLKVTSNNNHWVSRQVSAETYDLSTVQRTLT